MANIRSLDKLTLKDMIIDVHQYFGLAEGLAQLPIPGKLRIGKKKLPIPKDLKEFTDSLCYGQRIFLTQKAINDFDLIVRMIDGYYYTLYTKKEWDSDKALLFGKLVLTCKAKDIYPLAMYLTGLVNEMADREHTLLFREPSKMELAAGIEKLNIFSELNALDFLRDTMKCTVSEVLLTSYNECLVRFMIAKETNDYRERYFELLQEANKPKSKFK
jgi:hypothetical protein